MSLVETWNIVSRITLYLLNDVAPEALGDQLGSRAWSVGQHFAHLHNVRLMWLEPYKVPLSKFPKEQTSDKALLREHLEQSAEAMTHIIEQNPEKIKGFKRPTAAFVGYLVAHESYHHGEIGVILAQSGHRFTKEVAFGMWEWHKR